MECLLITPLIFLKVKPSSAKLMRSYELHFLSVCVCVCPCQLPGIQQAAGVACASGIYKLHFYNATEFYNLIRIMSLLLRLLHSENHVSTADCQVSNNNLCLGSGAMMTFICYDCHYHCHQHHYIKSQFAHALQVPDLGLSWAEWPLSVNSSCVCACRLPYLIDCFPNFNKPISHWRIDDIWGKN